MRQKLYNNLLKLIAVAVIVLSGSGVSGQTPVANFTATPLAGCSPLIVNFQNLSTGNPTTWAWSFGNGNTSTLQNPTATYFTPGTYTVSLTAKNANGTNTLTRSQYITVYESPTVDFSANILSGCFPLRVQFTDLSTPGQGNTNISWQWDFGNGTFSTQRNPLATYSSAGTYSVTLKVTNDKGCVKVFSRTNYIRVSPGVTAGFTNTQATVCSAPADITFTNTSTGPPTLSYLWDFGDGNLSAAVNPTHTYTANGTYIVTLITFSTAGCQDTIRSSVVIGGFNTTFTAPANVCINQAVRFRNTSAPTPASIYWVFGDGGTATTLNAIHVYTVPGSYTVWLYNTYNTCRDSVSHVVNVQPAPVADFTAPVTSKCQPPLTVNFQDLSTGGVTAWEWDFGDGSPVSTLQNPVHTYTSYGSFTVRLVAYTGFGCPDTIIKTNYIIIRRASMSLPGFPKKGCVPYTISPVAAISSVDPVTSYNWDFGDGGTSTLSNPVHTYTVQGTYTIRLIITTGSGCTDTLIVPMAVKVGTKPAANFTAAPIPVCGRQLVQFTDLTPVPVDEWLWDFGDGNSASVQNPTHSYNDTGYFNITLIAINNGCGDTLIKSNYVKVLPPIANFTPVPDCTNRLRFSFTDQSIAPLTWEWNFGDGSPPSFVQNPVHIFPALGSYNIRLIVTNGGCADTIIHSIQAVDENPDFTASQVAGCKAVNISFLASNIVPSRITSYSWDFGDGGVATVSTPAVNHTYTVAGSYTVTLTTTDINGCTDVATKTNYIRVNGPTAGFTATNTGGCAGQLSTTFNDASVTDGVNAIVNWQWDFGDGTIQNFSAPPFQHTYMATGTFSVRLIITDAAGCKDSLTIANLIIATDPVPDFTTTNAISCPGFAIPFVNTSTPGGFTSLWDFGDGNTSTITSPSHAYAATGVYDVKLRIQDAAGCADSITKLAYITIDKPIASFTVSDSASSCTPFEVHFTNTTAFYSTVFWDFGPGEGTSTLINPIHYYSTPGSYLVKLVVKSPGDCLDSVYRTITVYDTIGSKVDYLPLFGCKPLDVSLNTFTPGVIASYYWDFGDGYTQITTTPTVNHTYESFGSFLPKVIMEDPTGCIIPLQSRDTVLVIGGEAKFGADDNLFCDFGTVNFIDSTTFNDPVVSYNWLFGDGGTSILQQPVHQYTSPGSYTVSLIIQTQGGCIDTLSKPDYIKVIQRPLIDIGGDTVICAESPLIHRGVFLQPDTSVVTWSWNFPNGNSSTLQNPAAQIYNTAGTFLVTTIATNSSGCRDTTTQNILVNPLPVITMPGQMTVQPGFPVTIPATYSPNTVNWLWAPSTGLSCTNCPTPDAGPKFNTYYQVYFTDDRGCSDIGAIEVIVICKNANLFLPNTFTPNGDGSNDIFYPRGKGLERVRMLRIFNRWGEVVFERKDFPVNDASAGWNGTYKGRKPMADVYVYQVEVFCENGEIIKLNGNIALIL